MKILFIGQPETNSKFMLNLQRDMEVDLVHYVSKDMNHSSLYFMMANYDYVIWANDSVKIAAERMLKHEQQKKHRQCGVEVQANGTVELKCALNECLSKNKNNVKPISPMNGNIVFEYAAPAPQRVTGSGNT